jgi:hypothetical protein
MRWGQMAFSGGFVDRARVREKLEREQGYSPNTTDTNLFSKEDC